MQRRHFMQRASAIAAAGFTASMSATEKADAIEDVMIDELDAEAHVPWLCDPDQRFALADEDGKDEATPLRRSGRRLMGDDPRLPQMPNKPTLIDFFKFRLWPATHILQSATLAVEKGFDEKTVMACLLHDISIAGLMRSDHGYWGAQLVEPYVDEEVSWAIRYHQALRFFPDASVGYEYPQSYIKYFGEDYEPEPYIRDAYQYARGHKYYMTARLITVNDFYAFDPNLRVSIEPFTDIIGRHFKQPEEGLGFDNSPVAHMWRTLIWPNSFL